jgi:hypothetical protein
MGEPSPRGALDLATIRATPKVLLRDHIDGGLRLVVDIRRCVEHGVSAE